MWDAVLGERVILQNRGRWRSVSACGTKTRVVEENAVHRRRQRNKWRRNHRIMISD